MPTVTREKRVILPALKKLTVTASATSSGKVWIKDTIASGETHVNDVAASGTFSFGPFGYDRQIDIIPSDGMTLDYTFDDAPFSTPAQAAAAAAAAGALTFAPVLTNDVLDLVGAGVPVDYTDGTPPATGEATAGPGSRYTDITGKKLYINGGTKAQPVWKIVTSAV